MTVEEDVVTAVNTLSRQTPERARRVRLTARDTAALEWLAQQYGAPLDVVAELLGDVSMSRTYGIVRRWERANRVKVEGKDIGGGPDTGPTWVYPTRRYAEAYLGHPVSDWVPRPSTGAHVRAVAELRAAFCGLDLDPDRWVSERILRHRNRGDGQHLHDAWLTDIKGGVFAVEVELSPKFGRNRLKTVLGSVLDATEHYELDGVLYFTRGPVLDQVRAVVDEAVKERSIGVDVRDLDEFLAEKRKRRLALAAAEEVAS